MRYEIVKDGHFSRGWIRGGTVIGKAGSIESAQQQLAEIKHKWDVITGDAPRPRFDIRDALTEASI